VNIERYFIMLTMTSVEAQNRFGQLLDAAQREPIAITRHGRTAVFIVPPQDMAELTKARIKSSKAATAPSGIDWMLQQPLQTGGETGTSSVAELQERVAKLRADWSEQ
jgi:prevent-host-death family protein